MHRERLFKTVALAALASVTALGFGQAISVRVDGDLVSFPGVGPQKVNGRVLVPLRGVMEKLGAYVGYQPSTKTVTATKSGIDVTLRLGDREAVVNNRTVTLDVPAQEFRGSTMVPLRFVGEALGAEVRWNSATSTVDITTSGTPPSGDPNEYTPPTPGGSGDARIDSFNVEPRGFIRGGSEIRVRLAGSPGGRATFSIPGLAEDLRLTETSAGVYTGAFLIPEDRDINISRANAVGRLLVNGKERLVQTEEGISIDTQIPEVTAITPEPNSRVTRTRPNISVTFDDKSGSGIDSNSVQVRVDNKDVTDDAQITPQFMSYRPVEPLTAGRHDVTVVAKDRAGNSVTKNWAFRVAAGNEVIKSFTFEAEDQDLRPGTDVKFTLVGEPGGRASFSVGDRLQNIQMPEVEPGRYVATYTIRRNDNFINTQVVAKLVTKNGETFTSEASNALNVNVTLEPPQFTEPEENARVGSKVTLRGKAAPGSVVRIRIEYRKTALGVIDLKGIVADLEVTADNRGNWVTDPIDMDTGLGGGSATFAVTAVTVGANDKTSEPAILKLRR